MRFFDHPDREVLFGRMLDRAIKGGPGVIGFETWADALKGELKLYFEVGLSSPLEYRKRLRDELPQRNLVPYVIEAGSGRTNLEGWTHLDAILLAPRTGFAAHFEAKVTSDIDSKIPYDLTRNQIVRNLDVMLEPPGKSVEPPLSRRDPDRSVFVLLTPRMFKKLPHSRLYGWLMNEYLNDPGALKRDLPHREREDFDALAVRLGWVTWEDCNEIVPGSCGWLDDLVKANADAS